MNSHFFEEAIPQFTKETNIKDLGVVKAAMLFANPSPRLTQLVPGAEVPQDCVLLLCDGFPVQ